MILDLGMSLWPRFDASFSRLPTTKLTGYQFWSMLSNSIKMLKIYRNGFNHIGIYIYIILLWAASVEYLILVSKNRSVVGRDRSVTGDCIEIGCAYRARLINPVPSCGCRIPTASWSIWISDPKNIPARSARDPDYWKTLADRWPSVFNAGPTICQRFAARRSGPGGMEIPIALGFASWLPVKIHICYQPFEY